MNKEPESRYATAQELADDLRRFLEHKPIRAKRPTLMERAAKWGRRHRTLVAAAFLVLLFAVVGLAAGSAADCPRTQKRSGKRDEAHRQRQHARQAVDRMYTSVAEEWIGKQPRLEPLQREFLLEALRFYQGFSQVEANEPDEVRGKALAYRRVGDVQRKMGKYDEAQGAYRRALELMQDLVTRFPMLARTSTRTGSHPSLSRRCVKYHRPLSGIQRRPFVAR